MCIGISKIQIAFLVLGVVALGISLEKSQNFFRPNMKRLIDQTINRKSEIPKTSRSQASLQDLITAVSAGKTELVRRLVEEGVNINDKDGKGGTPLMYAAFNYQKDASILKLLLMHGADVNARDPGGATALMLAMGPGGSRAGIEALLEHNADVNIATLDGETPLMWASTWYGVEVIKLLIEKGAKVNARSYDGTTVLHIAARFYRAELVKLLLKNGADPLIRNKAGKTPLMLAQESYENKVGMTKSDISQLTMVINDLKSAEGKIRVR